MKVRNNIQPLVLVGDNDLAQAIGMSSPQSLAKLRKEGLPYGYNGKSFVYFPDEVAEWLKKHWAVQQPIKID